MVFVLYLAGLAVLIVVLALGLEFIQRRGPPTPAAPAADIFTDAAPFTVALAEAGSPAVDRNIRDALNRCLATKPGERTRVVYPNPAAANDRTTLSIKRDLIDWDVLYGVKILVVPGCYAYRTAGQVHHSAFCFFYQHGFSNPNDWAICQGGNYAD